MTSQNIQEIKYLGIANPSGAVALNDSHFIVADDEDNKLRIYNRHIPEKPLQTILLSAVFKGVISDGEDLEIDLESAAEIEDTVFWLGSHSTSKKGEFRPARHRLFAVKIKPDAKGNYVASPVGEIYTTLIDDLCRDSRFDRYDLDKAKKTQAKAVGGLSIEGLAATNDNELLIGFRNPLCGGEIKKDRLKNGKALIVKLKNPFEVIHGLKAKFADPIELDLDGFGIREITRYKKNKYLIVAGPYHENIADEDHKKEEGKLYEWSIKTGKLNKLKRFDLQGLNIEAAIFYPGDDKTVQLLSDDGVLEGATGFRSITIEL
jgi:Protein of unknown function (DUF3616)